MVYNFTNILDSWAQPQGYLREVCKSDMQCQKYRPEVLQPAPSVLLQLGENADGGNTAVKVWKRAMVKSSM